MSGVNIKFNRTYYCLCQPQYVRNSSLPCSFSYAWRFPIHCGWLIPQYPIWDTVNTDLADDYDYSPTVPGNYTWPLEGATGCYRTIIAGPLPPIQCQLGDPAGTELVGCFADSSSNRLFNSDSLVLNQRGPDGMTAPVTIDVFTSGVGT